MLGGGGWYKIKWQDFVTKVCIGRINKAVVRHHLQDCHRLVDRVYNAERTWICSKDYKGEQLN